MRRCLRSGFDSAVLARWFRPAVSLLLVVGWGRGCLALAAPAEVVVVEVSEAAGGAAVSLAAESAQPPAETINPFPPVGRVEPVVRWELGRPEDAAAWRAANDCRIERGPERFEVVCTGRDPYLVRPVDFDGGTLVVRLRASARALSGPGRLYWITDRSPLWGEDKAADFPLATGQQPGEVSVRLTASGRLRGLRLDPGGPDGDEGVWRLERIEICRETPPPLVIESADTSAGEAAAPQPGAPTAADGAGETGRVAVFRVRNTTDVPVRFVYQNREESLSAGACREIAVATAGRAPLEAAVLELQCEGFPPLRRVAYVYHPGVAPAGGWIERKQSAYVLQVAPDGSMARIVRGGATLAALGPLVLVEGEPPALRADAPESLRFSAEGVSVRLVAEEEVLRVAIESDRACEGPVVRVFGALGRGLLAGVEDLGAGERSSSKLDIETPEHLRFQPDPMHLTQPLAVLLTDRGGVAACWDDPLLRPTLAVPNFFDGAPDHRFSLKSPGVGRPIRLALRVGGGTLEDAIVWAVDQRGGLPALPKAPRSAPEQRALCVKGLEGPLRGEAGWGHCVEPQWARQPYADLASTFWRLTGEAPELPRLVPGGAHIPNDAIYFVTGRAAEWLRVRRDEVDHILARQRPDGSFRYDGPMRRGHFEDTALGLCAQPAARLLEFSRATGDAAVLESACRTLDFMRRFDVPRGGQTWEIPLHTPDLLAAAYAVWAYVRGYELTGRPEYLAEARRWAIAGVPFVYLWNNQPIMLYATTPVLGATQWRAPNWIGLPVQWVGLDYAYALAMLSAHDRALDWRHLAEGIMIAGEQMQYPDGPNAGLLPDSFVLATQERRPWNINPCALVSARRVLDGQLDALGVARRSGRCAVAPFPIVIEGNEAVVRAPAGATYQVLIDGRRVVEVRSKGEDHISLE